MPTQIMSEDGHLSSFDDTVITTTESTIMQDDQHLPSKDESNHSVNDEPSEGLERLYYIGERITLEEANSILNQFSLSVIPQKEIKSRNNPGLEMINYLRRYNVITSKDISNLESASTTLNLNNVLKAIHESKSISETGVVSVKVRNTGRFRLENISSSKRLKIFNLFFKQNYGAQYVGAKKGCLELFVAGVSDKNLQKLKEDVASGALAEMLKQVLLEEENLSGSEDLLLMCSEGSAMQKKRQLSANESNLSAYNIEDRSKAGVSGVSVPSDESRDGNEEISFSDGTVSRNEALVSILIIVLLVIAVGWSGDIVTIIISTLMVSLMTFSYHSKITEERARNSTQKLQQHSPIPEINSECKEVSPLPVSKGKRKLHELKAQCEKVEQMSIQKIKSGPSEFPILVLPLVEMSKNETCMIRKCELGTKNMGKEEKVIMLVGATGAGKTTLINAMVNYVLGVEWEDNFRFKMILDENEKKLRAHAFSQTQWITTYTVHHENYFKIPFTLSIIDTPGFGDTRGIEADKRTMKQIFDFFHTKGAGGIDHITAIGIVVPSTNTRLTHKQNSMFDTVLSLFGKDVEQNIFLMITFSDGQIPPVLDAITEIGIPHGKYFEFNNSALFAKSRGNNRDDDIDDDISFHSMVWKMGSNKFENLFVHIQKMENKSLQLTKDVLDERMSLETYVEVLKAGLNKLERLTTEVNELKQHQKDIELNKNFTYEITEETTVRKDIPNGQHTTTCLECNFTCHDSCPYGDDSDKRKCCVMKNGYCTVCPLKCYWQIHKNIPYRFIIKGEKKTKTLEDLTERYEKAVGRKSTAQSLIEKVCQEFTAVQMNVIYLSNQIRKSRVRLDQIALRPNPMIDREYIDIMAKSEKKEHKTGWKERVEQLEAARAQAKILNDLADENFDPLQSTKKAIKN